MTRVTRPPRTPLVVVCLLLAVVLAGPALARKGDKERKAQIAQLGEVYRVWLEEVDALITDDEVDAFLKLEKDYQRDAFIERFWQARDPYPDTSRNELRDRWAERVLQARQMFGSLLEDRARMLLLNGPPTGALRVRCTTILWPMEIWFYDGSEKIRDRFFLVFVQRGGLGAYRVWEPGEGIQALVQFASAGSTLGPGASERDILNAVATGCMNGDQVAGALARILRQGTMDYSLMLSRIQAPPSGPGGEWVATFSAYSTEVPADAASFPATLTLAYPARHQNRTVVQGMLAVPTAGAGLAQLGAHRSYNFVLTGEVLRGTRLFETFRYKFDFPLKEIAGESIPLVFERYLRPGAYRLVLKLEDLNLHAYYREQREVEVPSVEGLVESLPAADAESARLLAEANAAISSGDDTIRLVPPPGELKTGMVRFDTLTTGAALAEVVFELNGKPLFTKRAPPWSVELDLGSLPRTHTLRVRSLDAAGRELASDELLINAGAHRFKVRLLEPRAGEKYHDSLRAEAAVETPEAQGVERVEFFLNEERLATLYQPPWTQAIILPPGEPVAYVRAAAYLADGNSTEDVVFINAPDYLEEVDVQFVELYTTVVDRGGHPVEGLVREDFTVLEDGVEQKVLRFERVENLPVHAGVMLDISASMEERLAKVQAAALGFFEHAITPKDRAALVTFNDRPALAVRLTNDAETLAGGLAGLKAERGTALWDSLIFSLYYFNGVKGQRALIVLSDGEDENSRFSYEDTLDYARRSGVAMYVIGVDLARASRDARRKLARLADETGGRAFFIESIDELAAIYEQIQRELRSRYLVAYQSANASGSDKFRIVDVKLRRSGLEAKTLRGYYP